jgi:hypothetical protein
MNNIFDEFSCYLTIVPDDVDDERGAVGVMGIGSENRNSWRIPRPVPLCPPQIPQDMIGP